MCRNILKRLVHFGLASIFYQKFNFALLPLPLRFRADKTLLHRYAFAQKHLLA